MEFIRLTEYYCVLKGWDTGVFTTFESFMRATEDYAGAHFKRCEGVSEVHRYLAMNGIDGVLQVYTDGCTLRNGKVDASGGIGVFVAPNHPMNRGEPLTGKCTNQRAELMAVIRCIEEAIKNSRDKLVLGIEIVTDSEYTMNVLCDWLPKWRKNGYKKANGDPVQNLDLIRRLEARMKDYRELFNCDNTHSFTRDTAIAIRHVHGHTGIPGNEQADALARKGALIYRRTHFGY